MTRAQRGVSRCIRNNLLARASGLAVCAGSAALLTAGVAAQANAAPVTINPVRVNTYNLIPTQDPLTFGSGTNIQVSSGDGVYSNKPHQWTLTNNGLLVGSTNGIEVHSASNITNNALIEGNQIGVFIGAPSGSAVTNNHGEIVGGSLAGVEILGAGQVSNNAGAIFGYRYGVAMLGGSVTNAASSEIFSTHGSGVQLGQGSVSNAGEIFGEDGLGVFFLKNGSLTNTGYVAGYFAGAGSEYGNLIVKNQAFIGGNRYGVALGAGGSITNSGEIQGGFGGVVGRYESGVTNLVNNSGGILGGEFGVFFENTEGPVNNTVVNSGYIDGSVAGVVLAGGKVTNLASGTIRGGGAIYIDTAPGTVTNNGTIEANSGFSIVLSHGGTITNGASGFIGGPISSMGGPAINFTNSGFWGAGGANNFGGGVVHNNGTIHPGHSSDIEGASTFYNGSATQTGLINMWTGSTGDSLTISGPFVGQAGHSYLQLDAFLGGPGSQADQVHLLGGSSGTTLLRINDVNTGVGAVNSQGIVLVTGVSHSGNFAMDQHASNYDRTSGGIDKGLFVYKLQFQGGDAVLVGSAGAVAHQLSSVQSGGQNVLGGTNFGSGGGGSAGGAGFMGFTGAMGFAEASAPATASERPMFWTSAVGVLSSDALHQGQFAGAPGQSPASANPALRLSSLQSGGGYDTGYDQGLSMLKGGVDLIRHDNGRSAFSMGFGAAYIQSDQRFAEGGTAMFYSGAVYGGYAAFKSGGAWLQADVKSALLKGQFQTPMLAGASRPSAGLSASSAELQGGWSVALAPGWTLQPTAAVGAQRTATSDLQVGADLVSFRPSYDGWANFGARLAGETRAGAYRLSGSLTAKVWDRFGDDNLAYLAGLGTNSPLVDRLTGVSGEVAAELRVASSQHFYGFLQSTAQAGAARKAAAALAGFALRW